MVALVGALRAQLTMDSAAFVSGARRAESSSKQLQGKMAALATTMRRVGIGVAAAAGGLALAVKRQLNVADEMGKAAQRYGVPVEELSRLKYAAELSDVSLETLGTSLGQLSKKMLAAAQGSKAQSKLFADLGISVTDAEGKLRSSEAVLQDVAEAMARMPDGAEKTALAMELFGRSGAQMITLLNLGRDGLQAMADEANKLGIVIDENTAKSAAELNDNLNKIKNAAGGLVLQIAAALAPTLEKLSKWAVDVAIAFGELSPEVKKLIVQIGSIVTVVGTAAGAFTLLRLALGPVSIAVGAIATGAALIYANWDGIAAWFSEQWASIRKSTEEAWTAIKTAIGGAIDYVTGLWDAFVAKLQAAIQTAKDVGKAIAEAMKLPDNFAEKKGKGYSGLGAYTPGGGGEAGGTMGGQMMGAAIVNGMVIGAVQAMETRRRELANVFGQVTQIAKDTLGIHSPSRVFQEIGGNLSEGLAIGIRDKQPMVDQAMDELGNSIEGRADSLQARLDSFKSTMQNAFVGLATGAHNFKQAIAQVASALARMAAEAAFQQIFSGMFKSGGLMAGLFSGLFADGAAFQRGRVTAFATGGVVSGATAFAMQGGLGVMGEAGPEAIMPLARGRGGKLGVVAQGGANRMEIQITENPMFAARVEGIADGRAVQVVRKYDREVAPQTRNRSPRERG